MSRIDVMTVREMIDAAIVFGIGDPVVDFKLLESILYLFATHLNLLRRQVKMADRQLALAKILAEKKRRLKVTKLKIHGKANKKENKKEKKDSTSRSTSAASKSRGKSDTKPKDQTPLVFTATLMKSRRKTDEKSEYTPTRGRSAKKSEDSSTRGRSAKKSEDSPTRGRSAKKFEGSSTRGRSAKKSEDSPTRGRSAKKSEDSSTRGRSAKKSEDSPTRGRSAKKFEDSSWRRSAKTPKEYSSTESVTDTSKKHHYTRPSSGSKEEHSDEDVTYDKLLVVSETSYGLNRDRDYNRPVVTQEQYDDMVISIRKLQEKFDIVPDVDTRWSNLHKPTSLTDPRAALNLDTRLEASHKKLNEMLTVVTKFASDKPGIDINRPVDEMFTLKSFNDTGSEDTTTTFVKTVTTTTESEDDFAVVDTDGILKEIDTGNIATWPELKIGIDKIRNDAVRDIVEEATEAINKAKNAASLFKKAGPKLAEASVLSYTFSRLRVAADRLNTKAIKLDASMCTQLMHCQESLSGMQDTVETITERINELLSHPAVDPAAVAKIKDEFTEMLSNLTAANKYQRELAEDHEKCAADIKRLIQKVKVIDDVKTSREEALDALHDKAKLEDINGLLSKEQLSAAVGHIEKEIKSANVNIKFGEVKWQVNIEEHLAHLKEVVDSVQMTTLKDSMRTYYTSMSSQINTMLDIVGDLSVNDHHKKLDHDGNCLSCGIQFDIKVSEKYKEFAKSIVQAQHVKPLATHYDEESTKVCVPGRPIPHPLDSRALICGRYCGASPSLSSSLGLDVLDINPSHKTELHHKVYLTCTPCTHSE